MNDIKSSFNSPFVFKQLDICLVKFTITLLCLYLFLIYIINASNLGLNKPLIFGITLLVIEIYSAFLNNEKSLF